MRFLIAGLGSIGRRHLKNLISLGQKDILLFRSKLSTLSENELKDIPTEVNLQRALAFRPDAVIISKPTSLHLDVAIPAAQAGCSLFLEKPISNNLERIPELETRLPQVAERFSWVSNFDFILVCRQSKNYLRIPRLVGCFMYVVSGASTCLAGTPGKITVRDTERVETWEEGWSFLFVIPLIICTGCWVR